MEVSPTIVIGALVLLFVIALAKRLLKFALFIVIAGAVYWFLLR
jgi:hypothetical protein